MNKKILWIAHEANMSGANICLNEFITLTATTTVQQVLVLPHSGNMLSHATRLEVPVRVIHFYGWMRKVNGRFFNNGYSRRLLRNIYAVYELVKLIRKERITTVFTNTSTFNVGAWAASLTGTKHFWYVHELGAEDFGITVPRGNKSYRFMHLNSERIYTNSFFLKNKLLQKYPFPNIEVLPNPVLLKQHPVAVNWVKRTPFKLLILGQVLKSKGQHIAVEAIHILTDRNYDVSLSITGGAEDKGYVDELVTLIQQYNLEEKVAFKSFVSQPEIEISNHHALLTCSNCEAFGRVTIEAMKLGVPVIGANTCGTAEVIIDKESGWLFENGNPTSLAGAIQLMLEAEDLKTNIIAGASKRANEISDPKDFYTFLDSI